MLQRLLSLVVCVLCLSACPKQEQAPPFDASSQSTELLLELENGPLKSVAFQTFHALDSRPGLTYEDHLFGQERRYEGLNLAHLRHLAEADDSYTVLKLHCRDGYVSEVETAILEQGQFVLAYRDVDAAPATFVPYEKMSFLQTEPERLKKLLESQDLKAAEREELKKELDHVKTMARDMKNLKNQGPFYPIFLPSESLDPEKVWNPPFSVDKVVFAKSKTDRTAALPDGLAEEHPASRGAKLFKQRCATCHAVNGIGGQVGPELNRPMSVTEYWKSDALRQMMKDPTQVRQNSKMPTLRLKDEMIDDILAYLTWMAENKKVPVE